MSNPSFILLQIAVLSAVYLLAFAAMRAAARLLPAQDDPPRTFEGLDGIRGLAAVAVVACHVNQYVLAFLGITALPDFGNRFGTLGVQLFFALTAFLFTDRALSGTLLMSPFFVSRLRRIVPMYLVAATLALALSLIYTSHTPMRLGSIIGDVIALISFGFRGGTALEVNGYNAMTLIGVAWTLSYEWTFYVMLPALAAIAAISVRAAVLLTMGLVAVAARDFHIAGEVLWPFFLTGAFAALLMRRLPPLTSTARRVLTGLALLFVAACLAAPGFWSWRQLLLSAPVFLGLVLGAPALLRTRLLQKLGEVSYSIYILQYIVLAPLVKIIWEHPTLSGHPVLSLSVLALVPLLLVPLSCLTYRFVERPFMRSGGTSPHGVAARALDKAGRAAEPQASGFRSHAASEPRPHPAG